MSLRAVARVNVAAIERNVARLRRALKGAAELCAISSGALRQYHRDGEPTP